MADGPTADPSRLAESATRAGDDVELGGPRAMGAVLRELREMRGLTQAELARAALISRKVAGAHERGQVRNPSLLCVSRLADALEVSTAVFSLAFVRPAGCTSVSAVLDRSRRSRRPARLRGGSEHHGPRVLGTTLRALRSRAGVTQAEMGVGKYLSALERGQTEVPGLLTVALLATRLVSRSQVPLAAEAVAVQLVCAFAGEPHASAHEARPRFVSP